jgi:hypothetical protein
VGNGMRRGFGVVAVALVGVLAAGSAVAVAGQHKRFKPLPRIERAGVHADVSLIRADGATDTFAVDRGRVTAGSSASVTLQRRDGKGITLAISGDTRVRGRLQVGRGVIAFSRGGTAFRILAARARARAVPVTPGVPPVVNHGGVVHADVAVLRADGATDSRTFDRGRLTAASQTAVTLQRKDGRSTTLAINGDTRIHGKLAVGGKAAVISQGGTARLILVRGPRA